MTEISDIVYTDYLCTRILRYVKVERGEVAAFVVELEYGLDDEFYWPCECDDWRPVARFDHNPAAPDGNDIREEGLHLDIYRGDDEYYSTDDFPFVTVEKAPRWCEEYLLDNLDFLLERYEEFNDLGGRWSVTLRR
ncbi:DUF7718 family protein [Halorussus caseinilyticus]|uniref:DUF7718 family protein n=1 Tax=Halorussus caseinilyticus TaxID=3034025 RepID=UPI0023E80982|nr:hypothetical protein [Halorussus sp. DT72]